MKLSERQVATSGVPRDVGGKCAAGPGINY